jgi:hypothetical protein
MSTPHDLERAPAAWSAAQVAAARQAAAMLRASHRPARNPPVRRVQRFADPLVGYAVLVACLFLFGPILTCGGFTLPVLNCAGVSATRPNLPMPTASSRRPQTSGLGATDEAEEGAKSWYSYRGRDGVTVHAFGVPPLGSTIIRANPGSASGPDTGSSDYAGANSPSRATVRYRGR